MKESIRYFNGERLIEYSTEQKEVESISYTEGQQATVRLVDGTKLTIQSSFIEHTLLVEEITLDTAYGFGW